MFHKLIKTEDARNGKAPLKNELELAKKELEEWEERDCLSEEALFESANKCKSLRDEIEAIEEAVEALEAYERAIEYLELTWKQG